MGEDQQGYRLPAVAWDFGAEEAGPAAERSEAAPVAPGSRAAVLGAVPAVAEPDEASDLSDLSEPSGAVDPSAAPEPAGSGAASGAVDPSVGVDPSAAAGPTGSAALRPEVPGAAASPAPGASAPAEAAGDAASAQAAELDEVSTAAPGAEPEGWPRISRPMIAAAVTAGLVLVGLPLGLTQLGGSGPHHGPAQGGAPVGFSQQGGSGGGNGYVPGFDSHGDIGGPPVGSPAGPVGAVPVPADSGSPSPAAAAAGAPADAPAAGRPQSGGQPGGSAGGAANGSSGGSGASGASGASGGSGGSGGSAGGPGGSGGGAPQPPVQQPAPPPVPAAPQPSPHSLVAGPNCSQPGALFHQYGWFSDGTSGWRSNGGGWTGDQCNGTFTSVPMSGDANKDDGNSVIWTFTGLRTASGSCAVSVYIPASSDVKVVGGNPTYYTVQTGTSPNSGTIGSFSITQVANLGSWVAAGSYPVSGGSVSVMLHTRGLDWNGSSKTYAHHAADAVKVTCSY